MKGGYPLRIDFHTHVFPDKLAEKALTSISEHTGAQIGRASCRERV